MFQYRDWLLPDVLRYQSLRSSRRHCRYSPTRYHPNKKMARHEKRGSVFTLKLFFHIQSNNMYRPINNGEPQGSTLGPTTFTLNITLPSQSSAYGSLVVPWCLDGRSGSRASIWAPPGSVWCRRWSSLLSEGPISNAATQTGFLEKGDKECPKPIMKWEDDQAVRETARQPRGHKHRSLK